MSIWSGRPHLSIFRDKEEDRFTQFLGELLLAPAVLDGFLKEVCGLTMAIENPTSARTQVTVPGGRPDLAIRGNSLYLLFEAKVGSWLHKDQLKPYAQELEQWQQGHPLGTACLFVVAPQRQVSEIVNYAKQELSESGFGRWCPRSISWEKIGTLCKSLEPEVGDRRLALHLAEFAEIISYRLGEQLRPFTAEECKLLEDPLAAQAIGRSRMLVNRVIEMLLERGVTFNASTGFLWDGYNARYSGRGWWYGVWIDAWAKVGSSPIFLELSGFEDQLLPSIPEGLPTPVSVRLDKLRHLIPLRLREGVEINVLADEHATLLWQYITEVPESGAG